MQVDLIQIHIHMYVYCINLETVGETLTHNETEENVKVLDLPTPAIGIEKSEGTYSSNS